MNNPEFTPAQQIEHRRAAAALEALCDDYGDLEALALLIGTFPSSYGLSEPLVVRLTEVSEFLHEMHDDHIK